MKKQTVWVAQAYLAETVIAVGSTRKKAIQNCAARGIEFLTNRDCSQRDGTPWNTLDFVGYFCPRCTEVEIDGVGEIE